MGRVRVVSIPAGHIYPAVVSPAVANTGVEVLADPIIDPAQPHRWWPHPALTRTWWQDQDPSIDVCHLHFGFEHLSLAETREFIAVLDQWRVALVVTIHDLDNPHLVDQTDFHRQLGILIAAAARVLTLSQQAAEIIAQRYHRTATVVPHPPVVADEAKAQLPATTPAGIGVFLKSLRANVVADPEFYRELAAGSPEPVNFYLHHDRADSELAGQLPARMLIHHDPMPDQVLFRSIAAHQVVVLPYQRGTHSGWLEMCLDLGVKVAVPDCGCYHSQARNPGAVASYRSGDGADAARAVTQLLRGGKPAPRIHDFNNQEFHHQLYRELQKGTRR